MVEGNDSGNSFAKTICSICFDDLKPIVEDLQSISVCGHVFHELCLQQWFEYCPNVKKRSCPICKQKCTNANVARLYFQSVGDPNDSSLSQKPHTYEENPEELHKELHRLEGKTLALVSSLEKQQKEFKEVKDQLFSCNERLKAEVALKNEALAQFTAARQLLHVKSEEQSRLASERTRLQDRNMALAKELAALKLTSDLNLDEDEIMKLASFGNEVGSKDSIDVLRKSLVIRNKSYKELMSKCNILGRGEAQCLRKLEKANEKIKKLKLRVQEVETAVEIKENAAIRGLKDQDINLKGHLDENTMKRPMKRVRLEETSDIPGIALCSRKAENYDLLNRKTTININVTEDNEDQNNLKKDQFATNQERNISRTSTPVQGLLSKRLGPPADNSVVTPIGHPPIDDASFDTKIDVRILKSGKKDEAPSSSGKYKKEDQDEKLPVNVDDEVICYGDSIPVQTSVHIRKESGLHTLSPQPGNCFSGGLLGPDGTSWHLGKWCKKGQKQGSTKLLSGSHASNVSSGGLIAVGADGRGGQIKVMRSLDQSSSVVKENLSCAKKFKPSPKPIKLQSQGHLQIEHFFQRTN